MAITFKEVTSNAGIAFAGRSYGAAWGDFNNDSFPDLWVNNHFGSGRTLYLNQGNGSFTDVTAEVFLAEELSGDFHGSAWADFDNDGDQDLIQLVGGEGNTSVLGEENLPPDSEPNFFYINDEGVLKDQARTLGLNYDSAKAQTPVWWDFDNDGLLDLFHGATQRADGINPVTVFRQTGDGFEDVGLTTLPSELQSQTIQYGVLSDLTGDGNLELILPPAQVILDTSSTPFADITTSLLTNPGLIANDLAAADFNNDLRPDLYLARGGNDRLLLNSDQGLIDSSNEAGINNFSNSDAQSVVAGDLDNDMDVDIYVVRGTDDNNLPNLLYENQGDGTFIAVPDAGGAAGSSIGRGDQVVTADYDLDGFLDLFVTNGAGAATDGPQQLFRNQGNNNNWLEIDLEGVESNRDGIGAQVFL
ncbi:MAG: VCBS repeat-containing protein, partial [Pleurocapsa sp. MO_192.B19]|nr:VCBS repeat-containing protein [Pleurocapsa sp. MO_192.B19]